jgi:hypothetical protein
MVLKPPSELAFVGADRQLHLISPGQLRSQQLTWPGPAPTGQGSDPEDSANWPVWSPDGRWIAFLRKAGEGTGAMDLSITQVNGVQEQVLHRFEDRLPLYFQWSPNGKKIAVVAQHLQEVELWVVDPQGARLMEVGVPLFFSWLPDSQRLVVHAGASSRRSDRLLVRSLGSDPDLSLTENPGSFCAPVVTADRIVFAIPQGSGTLVCSTDHRGNDFQAIAELPGLTAFLASPDGRSLALAGSPRGPSHPYQGIHLCPISGGELRPITQDPCLAFSFCPDSEGLVWASLAGPAGPVTWWTSPQPRSVPPRKLANCWPTRDTLFQLHFFEQFLESHPMISPDGRFLAWSAFDGPPHAGPSGKSAVFVCDLADPQAQPRRLADGSFAVFCRPFLKGNPHV